MTDTAATRPYGVLGRVLGHSYTPTIYKELAGLEYVRFEREPEDLEAFMTGDEWEGTNVTIPYKRAVMEYLDELSPLAERMGNVNTITRLPDGRLHGDNTDYFGFQCLVEELGVEVAGKKMQPDFEPVIERKFHNYINCIEGVYHTGQRDMQRIRISIEAFNAGFRIKHIGEVLYSQVKNEFAAVVDKCQVTIYTDPAECTRIRHEVAIPVFDKRDERLDNLTDESVDVYYSCILCQAFSPSHVCVVTPERLGLCGAVSWLDAKATNQLDPAGPCQVITKERPIDENLGSYEDVDEAVQKFSQGALEHVTLYSIMQDPMTSCGCFECICGIEPFSNCLLYTSDAADD